MLILVVGTGAAQGVLILSAPILTRLYTPSDLGALSVFTAILSVLLTITCLSYELAIPLPEDDVGGSNVVALCLFANAFMSLLAAAIAVVVGPPLMALLGAPTISGLVVLVAVAQFAGGVAIAMNGWAIRARLFPLIAGTHVLQSGALVTTQIALGAFGSGPIGLLLADIMSRIVASLNLGLAVWRDHSSGFRGVSRSGLVQAAVRYRRFPLLSTPSALLNTLGLQAPTLLIVALYGTGVGGELFLAQRVAALPMTLVARSVGQVYFSEGARITREEPAQLQGLFLRTTRRLARAGIGPTLLVMIASPILFAPVFGEPWRQAGWFAALLAPMYFLTLVTSPTGATLDVLERQDLHLTRELLRLCLVGGAVLLAAALHLPPIGAIAVLSVAGCATYGLYGYTSWRAIVSQQRHLPPTSRGQT